MRLVQSLIAAALIALASTVAFAADKRPFDPAAFEAAQRAGQPILVEVHASWCSVCKAQEPILAAVTAKPEHNNLAVFRVDFDSQKDVLQTLRVTRQSTLIVFKGGQEVGRSVGDTNAASIEQLVSSTRS
jgi:thioredoxin 1